MNICENCEAQKSKGRRDNPHASLEIISTEEHRGSMFGGSETIKYRCNICGSSVTHYNDKNEFSPFWNVN